MIKVTDKTYFDYLDDLLSPEDVLSFEEYIANNPDAKSRLNKLVQEEEEFNKKINDPNYPKISDKFSKEIQKMQESLDLNKSKKNSFSDFVKKMFLPLWEIPIQAKAVVVALPVGVYLLVMTTFVPMQVAQNQASSDFFMQLANLNELQQFIPKSQYGDMQAVKFNNIAWNIKDISTNLKTRSAAQASTLSCSKNLDSKIIEIFPTDKSWDKKTLTYCSEIDKNNWRLLNIEFKKDEKPLNLNSSYKIIMEKNSVFLFPQNSE
jgi:hypothetical protein|tara:strand:- start:32 stop:820 length:789 start_codon:yes stop_codon:yes gene_type:complete